MGSIYLVRHGQASFGKADYDELSTKGHRQSQVLGKHWVNCFANTHGNPNRVVSGTLKRHRQTAEGCMGEFDQSYAAAEIDGFNEFDHLDVLHKYKPAWVDRSVMVAELATHDVPRKAFEAHFGKAVSCWIADDCDDGYKEPWPVFKSRVEAAFEQLVSNLQRSENVVVFTSGGPIAVICGKILGLDVSGIFSINQILANTGVTKVLCSGETISLSSMNNYTHLECHEKGLLTYR